MMSDLDLGMNEWTTSALKIDESRQWDRGKVLDAEELEKVSLVQRRLLFFSVKLGAALRGVL